MSGVELFINGVISAFALILSWTAFNMNPSSRFFTIENPLDSSALEINALIHYPPSHNVGRNPDPTIICLHYWGGSASTYHHIPPALFQATTLHGTSPSSTVIAISVRGWGGSSCAIPDHPASYSIKALASDVFSLLPRFVEDDLIPSSGFVLCGHSMGGKVCMAILDMITSSPFNQAHLPPLRGIVLLAPAPPTPLVLPVEMREQQSHAYETRETVEWTVRNVLASDNGVYLRGGEEDIEVIIRDSLSGSDGAKKGWVEFGMAERIEVSQATSEHFPVRILASNGDKVEPVEKVKKETKNSFDKAGFSVRVRVIEENCGHLIPLEAPHIVVEELVSLLNDVKAEY
ncbi:alpha/beta-hydrolase [Atractiella rhizophila]|nr:alpha/beta-hydrolase [Atractiella rhizophila]